MNRSSWAGQALSGLTNGDHSADSFDGLLADFMYPFQLRFLGDRARRVAWESSRQIGKSFTIAWKALLRAAAQSKRHQNLFAASERQSMEVLDKVASHIALIHRLKKVKIISGTPSKHEITLINGSKIRCFPANPRTVRGVSGDVYVDEAAHISNDKAFWTAAVPVITRGFDVTLTSTPLGDEGIFYDATHPIEGAEFPFSVHKTTIYDAISEGLDVNVREIEGSMDADSFAQEYLCAYLSVNSTMFPWKLLRAQIVSDKVDADLLAELHIGKLLPTFMGVDVGRRRDLTSIVVGYEFPEGQVYLQPAVKLRDKPFAEQRDTIRRLIRQFGVQACKIDSTGLGMQLAEELTTEFPGLVQAVDFSSGGEKNRLVTQTKIALERGSLWFSSEDGEVLADFHKIRRLVTPAGNVVFDAPRDKTGHADHFWSSALCLDAATFARGWAFHDVNVSGLPGSTVATGDGGWGIELLTPSGPPEQLRTPTAAEFGFDTTGEDELEDIRDLLGDERPDDELELPDFDGSMPPRCSVPLEVLRPLIARRQDPCWGCDEDRRVCEGRPRRPGWKVPEPPPPTRVFMGDALRDLVVGQGHVPPGCHLDGKILWPVVSRGADPCASCALSRAVCRGRPQQKGQSGPADSVG